MVPNIRVYYYLLIGSKLSGVHIIVEYRVKRPYQAQMIPVLEYKAFFLFNISNINQ